MPHDRLCITHDEKCLIFALESWNVGLSLKGSSCIKVSGLCILPCRSRCGFYAKSIVLIMKSDLLKAVNQPELRTVTAETLRYDARGINKDTRTKLNYLTSASTRVLMGANHTSESVAGKLTMSVLMCADVHTVPLVAHTKKQVMVYAERGHSSHCEVRKQLSNWICHDTTLSYPVHRLGHHFSSPSKTSLN